MVESGVDFGKSQTPWRLYKALHLKKGKKTTLGDIDYFSRTVYAFQTSLQNPALEKKCKNSSGVVFRDFVVIFKNNLQNPS